MLEECGELKILSGEGRLREFIAKSIDLKQLIRNVFQTKEMILKTWNIINDKNTTEMVNNKKKLLFSHGSLNMLHGFKEKI